MALIGQIRKNSWLLIVMIGLGLAGFVLMDMFSGQQSLFGGTNFTMGEVAGSKIDYQEFSNTEDILYGNSSSEVFGRRSYLWNYFVEKALVEKESNALGLGVSKDELMDLQFGTKPSPVVQQRFRNPNTGVVDQNQLNGIKQQIESNTMDPTLRNFWAVQEREIVKQRLQDQLNALVSKGLYAPNWMVDVYNNEKNQTFAFNAVTIPFDRIEDNAIQLSDDDYTSYLADNGHKYMRDEESRVLSCAEFTVLPTRVDSAKLREDVVELMQNFKTAENDSLFVVNNYGVWDAVYYKRDDLSEVLKNTLFDLSVNSVYGPYIDQGNYRAIKVLDKKVIPDSVRARHILIRATSQQEYFAAQQTIDSLKGLIEAGTHQFDSLAMSNSQDYGSGREGGDLGFAQLGMMVKPFNDLIFYEAEPGEANKVFTQFGVHLVEVTDRKYINNESGIQYAYLNSPIIPSQETQDSLYELANRFISENQSLEALEAAANSSDDINLITTTPFQKNDFNVFEVGTGNTAREMIRYAYTSGTDVGAVSPEVYVLDDQVDYFNSKYYVAALKTIQPKGKPVAANMMDQLRPIVLGKKKGVQISGQISGSDISAIASQFDVEVDSISNASFGNPYLPKIGNEPLVAAAISKMSVGDVSQPIVGNNGVYVIQLTNKAPVDQTANLGQLRKEVNRTFLTVVRNELIPSLKKTNEISDNRFTFY